MAVFVREVTGLRRGSHIQGPCAVLLQLCVRVCGVCTVITFVLVLCVCDLFAVGNDLEGTPRFFVVDHSAVVM